jgi:hypothetical protein
MFEEFMGIPAHPLLVHAAVVFAPLLIISVIVYAFAPMLRARIGWIMVALAVVAPLTLWFAKLSGDAFRARMVARNATSPEFLAIIDNHRDFGESAALWGTALGLLALALFYVLWTAGKRPVADGSKIVQYALIAVTLAVAVVTGYYAFKAGDTGAKAVWTGQ